MDSRAMHILADLPAADGLPLAVLALEHLPLPVSLVRAVRDESGAIIDFCIEYSNLAAAATVAAEDRTSSYGRPLDDVLPAFAELGLNDRYAAAVEDQQVYTAEGVKLAGEFDGVPVDLVLDIVAVPLGNDFLLSVAHDRTKEHHIGTELTQAQQQLQRRREVERQIRTVNDGLIAHLVAIQRALDEGDVRVAHRHAAEGAAEAADVVVGLRSLLRYQPR